MEPNKSEHLYTVHFDEQQEAWYVQTHSGHLPLSRVLLQQLVNLYNNIHRGAALTLIDRRAMEELGRERLALADPAPSLHAAIAAERRRAAAEPSAAQGGVIHPYRRALRLLRRLLRAAAHRR